MKIAGCSVEVENWTVPELILRLRFERNFEQGTILLKEMLSRGFSYEEVDKILNE